MSCDVAIFGGGFGGLYTALALTTEFRRKQQDPFSQTPAKNLDIVLVDPSDRFVFLPLLYDLTVGTATEREVCPYYKDILKGTGIRHVKARLDCMPDMVESSSLCHSANLTIAKSGLQTQLSFQSAVVAVGATPESVLTRVPGAMNLTQPFYTREHAIQTQDLLQELERKKEINKQPPRIAVVGGGYGGVELAACVKRRIPSGLVTLLTRTPPLQGTRAEPLIDQALSKIGVNIDLCGVESIEKVDMGVEGPSVRIQRTTSKTTSSTAANNDDEVWDAVLWTAGSGPAYPVSNYSSKYNALGLEQVSSSGRLKVDKNLRCHWGNNEATADDDKTIKMNQKARTSQPSIWALGDCAEMIHSYGPTVPKTASAAIQQADVVANNILHEISVANKKRSLSSSSSSSPQAFEFQDMGMMMSLGGPNAAILAPMQDSIFKPLFTPLLDISRVGLGFADEVLTQVISQSPVAESMGIKAPSDMLGLSFGGYGLGVDTETTPGTLAGTLAGAARRAVYAVRMPTNQQRAYAAASAALSTVTALSKEVRDNKNDKE